MLVVLSKRRDCGGFAAQHHSQQLSRAAVCGDAQNINNAARNMRVAHSFMTGLNCPIPLRAGLLGPRVVSPHPQGLQGSHLNLAQTSAQRHRTYFLLNNKVCEQSPWVPVLHV